MVLSKKTFETIMDLIENKMSCMEGWDQATSRERAKLETCRKELLALMENGVEPRPTEPVILSQGLSHKDLTH